MVPKRAQKSTAAINHDWLTPREVADYLRTGVDHRRSRASGETIEHFTAHDQLRAAAELRKTSNSLTANRLLRRCRVLGRESPFGFAVGLAGTLPSSVIPILA